MTKEEAVRVIQRVVRAGTGYNQGEAFAYSRGVADALTIYRPGYFLAYTEPMVEQLAQQLVEL